jgi:hypothetical protein
MSHIAIGDSFVPDSVEAEKVLTKIEELPTGE